jgi:hypothetical protein
MGLSTCETGCTLFYVWLQLKYLELKEVDSGLIRNPGNCCVVPSLSVPHLAFAVDTWKHVAGLVAS